MKSSSSLRQWQAYLVRHRCRLGYTDEPLRGPDVPVGRRGSIDCVVCLAVAVKVAAHDLVAGLAEVDAYCRTGRRGNVIKIFVACTIGRDVSSAVAVVIGRSRYVAGVSKDL